MVDLPLMKTINHNKYHKIGTITHKIKLNVHIVYSK